ncbi:MAG: N-acetylmuramoyl-L-alanine amidase family protein [Defluviitaleaceae bacterium]|nr:N-acetylmuramoyl-L-alanine amidase family protein [Defluviitaleaceae bacterium]
MKKFIHKIITVILVLAVLPFFNAPVLSAAARPVQIIVDGTVLNWKFVQPIQQNGRVFVPVREFTEQIGGQMGWHSANQQASLFYKDDVLVLTMGLTAANLNGRRVVSDYAPFAIDERMMAPVRFLAEIFGFNITWCGTRTAAVLNSSAIPSPSPEPTPIPTSAPEPTPTPEPTPIPNSEPLIPNSDYLAIDASTSEILPENHPQTTITHLLTPAQTGLPAYAVQAFSAITDVTYFMLPDNRLVIDIHNSLSAIEGPYYIYPALPISGIRSSQFSRSPNITRLVFDIVGAAEYNISLSADRRTLTVAFGENRISGVDVMTEAGTDSLLIQGDALPAARYTVDALNRRLTVDIDNAALNPSLLEAIATPDAVFISHMTIGQREDGSAYVHAYFKDDIELPEAAIIHHDARTIRIMLYASIMGVSYEPALRAIRLCRADGLMMDTAKIQHFDEYLRNRYTLVLPPEADTAGQGIVPVGDGFINSFMLARDVNGNIQLIIDTAQTLTFEVYETEEAYYVMARLPREVYSLVVVIDPGHGGNDPGVVRNGIREKDLAMTVSNKVAGLLSQHPYIGVYMTRQEDTNPCIFWRAEFAGAFADVMLSVHVNGFTNTAIHGIETHFAISSAEAGLVFNSRDFAQVVQRNKIAQTGTHSRGLFNTPAFVVIREAGIPAVISEMGFISNAAEAARLATGAYQWQIAYGLYNAILETHGIIGR